MSNTVTKHMIELYQKMAAPLMFLSGLFQTPERNFYSSEKVEVDVVRGEENVSIVIQDLSTGHRMNSADIYTNKEFAAPIHKEAIPLNSHDLLKRMPGRNPFESPEFRSDIITRMFMGMQKIERKIRRACELQASQVLQTGVVTLIDSTGATLYTVDYKPKAAHFPTAGTAWDNAASDKAADLAALANVVRGNGLVDPNMLIMGEGSFEEFVKDDEIQKRYDNRRFDLGTISPMVMRGKGGQYRGVVEIGNYRYDIWTYGGRYKHPSTGASTKFVADDKVIMLSSESRLDATFGAIPNIGRVLGAQNVNLIPELPSRIANASGGMDLHTNVWLSNDGEQLFGGVGARPLYIPTAIDTFGCLTTGI